MGDIGVKDYKGKARWSLLPYEALEPVVRVLEYGAITKYVPNNWKYVKQKAGYVDAIQRHWIKYFIEGEEIDPESGESHLANLTCCVLFAIWDRQSKKDVPFDEYLSDLLNYSDYKQEVTQESVDNKEYRN